MVFRKSVALAAASLLPAVVAGNKAVAWDAMKHYVQEIYTRNFDNTVGTSLPLTVTAVWYYKGSDRTDAGFMDTWNDVAEKTKKMVKILAMDCEENAKHCDREGVSDGAVMMYPQSPQPKYKYAGKMETDAILKHIYKNIPGDKVKSLTKVAEYEELKKKNPTKIKVVFFSDKSKPPTIVKGLSTDSVFARTVEFAFVGPEGDEVAEAAGAKKKKLPAIQLVSKGKGQWYKEKDMSFSALHEWINLFSESGMGDTVKGAGAEEMEAEEGEFEKVRELHAKSQNDLCFKQKNVCAIWLQEGALSDKDADTILGFENKFAPKTDRGIRYNWMWLDVSQESEFKSALVEQENKVAEKEGRDPEAYTYPTMIFVKPPKKKREEKLLSYIRMPSGTTVSEDSVGDMIERISGGAMYTRVDLPKMAVRAKAKAKAKAGKEEL